MSITLPHTIQNPTGERLIFKELVHETDGDRLIVEGHAQPGSGPLMHTHFKQDESLTVRQGRMGYKILGGEDQFAIEGETVLFKRGTPHRFWNAGNEELIIDGWVKPANTIVFFLSSLYEAQNRSGKPQPEQFDAAFLMSRYKNEYDLPELPSFVKKVIIPITYGIGKLLGKYKKFKDAPKPV